MYCDPAHLAALILQAQETGVVGEELVRLVGRIAHGVWTTVQWMDEDDLVQETMLRFMRWYRKCDVSRPPSEVFSWVTQIAKSAVLVEITSRTLARAKLARYFAALVEAGDVPQT